MTVAELIAALQICNPEAKVLIEDCDTWYFMPDPQVIDHGKIIVLGSKDKYASDYFVDVEHALEKLK